MKPTRATHFGRYVMRNKIRRCYKTPKEVRKEKIAASVKRFIKQYNEANADVMPHFLAPKMTTPFNEEQPIIDHDDDVDDDDDRAWLEKDFYDDNDLYDDYNS